MLLGETVGREVTFLQRPPAADDDGDQMEVDDGDGMLTNFRALANKLVSNRKRSSSRKELQQS